MYTLKNIKEKKSQIKNQINQFNNEFSRVNLLKAAKVELYSKLEHEMNEYIRKVLKNALGSDSIVESHKSNLKISFTKKHFNMDVIKSVYQIKVFDSLYPSIEKLLQEQKEIHLLLPKTDALFSVFWFLNGSQKKQDIVKNSNVLNTYINKHYHEQISYMENQLWDFNDKEVTQDYKNNIDDYVAVLNALDKGYFYNQEDPEQPDYSLLTQRYFELYERYKKIDEVSRLLSKFEAHITKQANLLWMHEVHKILETIDINEIKKYVKRISINALKDYGLTSVADIVDTSVWEISGIRGISEQRAFLVKKSAEIIKNETQQITQIKLNLDNQTNESTDLLYALYRYDQNISMIKEAISLNAQYDQRLCSAMDLIVQYKGDIEWIQSSFEQKNIIATQNSIIFGEDAQRYLYTSDALLNRFERNKQPLNVDELWKYFQHNSARLYSLLDELCPGLFGNGDVSYGLPEDLATKIQNESIFSDGLLVTLRRYQELGVKYILHQRNVLLGDEMGLGKTIQSIATMVSLKNIGARHFLVVCPKAVVYNWCQEIEKHSKLKAIIIHGSDREKFFTQWMVDGGVGVTTYEMTKFFKDKERLHIDLLVVDEAHYIKNPNAVRTKNVVEIGKKTERKLYLTGTVLENKVDEMVELIRQLNPKIAQSIENVSYLAQAEFFKQKVAPVYYRRKREDVLTELPDLIEKEAWCLLNCEEEKIYEESILQRESYPFIRRVSWHVDDLHHSSKAERLLEIIHQAKEDNRKVIVFSYFLDTIKKIRKFLGPICLPPIIGQVSSQERQTIIKQFDEANEGVVLLGQIQAAGTGLNIQSASVVVITEPQLKPSIENQAISRAYRMGQTRNVWVYRLLCVNTVDEKIRKLLLHKQEIFDAFADESLAGDENLELNDSVFKNILEEEFQRIKKEKGMF